MTRARFPRAARTPISKRGLKVISYNLFIPNPKEKDMADKKNDLMLAPKSGVIHDLVVRLKLILGLMGDNRVNILLKALPVASLAYLFWPFDLISVIPGISALDDVAIVSLGAYLFVELCPPAVVQEHMKRLLADSNPSASTDIVDADVTEIKDEKPQ